MLLKFKKQTIIAAALLLAASNYTDAGYRARLRVAANHVATAARASARQAAQAVARSATTAQAATPIRPFHSANTKSIVPAQSHAAATQATAYAQTAQPVSPWLQQLARTNKQSVLAQTAQQQDNKNNRSKYRSESSERRGASIRNDPTSIVGGFLLAGLFSAFYSWYTHVDTFHYGPAIKKDKPITIFAHGFRQSQRTGAKYHSAYNRNGFIISPLITFNFDHAHDIHKICFAQDAEMNTLHQACKQNCNNPVDLAGVSNGASTIFTYLGSYKPEFIKSAVMESPFDDVTNSPPFRKYQRVKFVSGLVALCVATLAVDHHDQNPAAVANVLCGITKTNYNYGGISPIDVARRIPHQIPVLLINTEKDDVVVPNQTYRLFKAMKTGGHPKVHLLRLKESPHAGIVDHPQEGEILRNVTHAFYRKYDRPFNKAWADAGQETFDKCL